jgi:uncharacterized protein YndB with AHSA1/START domain
MANEQQSPTAVYVEPLTISRVFPAPRELVFKAWSRADHIKRWFSPATYTTPEAEIDFRPGGVFVVCMRSPEGQDFWSRGTFLEISPPERLALALDAEVGGVKRFTAHTAVTFEVEERGTRMTVRQSYEFHDLAFVFAARGAPEGWRTTLDKLEKEVARMQVAPPRSVVHGVFTIQRSFAASPTRVYRALTDKEAKARWFGGAEGFVALERQMDVRPGGRERVKGRWPSGLVTTFDAVYFDVVADERLVYAYELSLDNRKISVSLATLQLEAEAGGTRLTVTEQGAFLDGYDDAGAREHGTGAMLDALGASLEGGSEKIPC